MCNAVLGQRRPVPARPVYTVTVVTTALDVYRRCCRKFSYRWQSLSQPIAAVFAKRLKAARAMRGLSQRALGGLVSDDKASGSVRINRYEQQVNRADMDAAAALARALDVPLAFLFAEEDDQAELLLAFAKLSKADRTRILKQAIELADEQTTKKTPSKK